MGSFRFPGTVMSVFPHSYNHCSNSYKCLLARTGLERFLFCLWVLNSIESYALHLNRQQSTELVLTQHSPRGGGGIQWGRIPNPAADYSKGIKYHLLCSH